MFRGIALEGRFGRSMKRTLVPLGAAAALLLAVVGPAAAALYDRESYAWSDSGSYECGAGNWVDWEAHGRGVFSLRTGGGPVGSAFFGHDNYHWQSVDTRRSDGLQLFASGDGNFKETRATRIEGNVFQFWAVNAGRHVVTDGSGKVLVRDAGVVRESILFDTLGDDLPGGIFIEQVSFDVEGLHTGDLDYCAYFG